VLLARLTGRTLCTRGTPRSSRYAARKPMRVVRAFVAASIAVLLAAACSASSSLPPVEGTGGGGGGGGGGGSSGAGRDGGGRDGAGSDSGTCGVGPNSSQCDQCLASRCCLQLQSCTGNPGCNSLLRCVNACGGGAACVNNCEQNFPTGVGSYAALSSCSQACLACRESGVGDPCGSGGYPCAAGLTCNGAWCTRPCNRDSDCVGMGAGGDNYLGFGNVCVRGSAGPSCSPGCMLPNDCSGFPGDSCVVAIDAATGANVFACGSIRDASAE
jgi:hypothetical protein